MAEVELKHLFEKRDEAFKIMSEGIFRSIPHVIDGAQQFISQSEASSAKVSWEDITYFDDDHFVMLIGVVEYMPGDSLQMPNGETIEVTVDTQEYFKRYLRFGIPYALAAEGSAQDVYDFLMKSVEENEEVSDEDGDSTAENFEEMLREHIAKAQETVDEEEFDLDGLTEEQRQQLKLFNMSHGGKN